MVKPKNRVRYYIRLDHMHGGIPPPSPPPCPCVTVLIHCKVQKLFKWDPEQQTLFPLNLRTVVCFLHFFVKILTPPPFFLQTILSGKHFRVPTTLAVEVESRELYKKYLRYLGHVPQLSASHKVRIGIMRHVPSQVQN